MTTNKSPQDWVKMLDDGVIASSHLQIESPEGNRDLMHPDFIEMSQKELNLDYKV